MLQINPYYSNVNTELTDTFKYTVSVNSTLATDMLAVDQGYNQYTISTTEYQVDLFTATINWSNYIGATTWATDGYINNIYNELLDANTGYSYQHRQATITRTDLNTPFEIEFNIIPEEINYLFMFITPIITLTQPMTYYSIGHIQGAGASSSGSQQIHITGTGIINNSTIEVVDIGGLMFDIVGMPFYFISTAFNLTLFPGTPYQINISSLFLSLIAVLVFIFLLRLLLKVGK